MFRRTLAAFAALVALCATPAFAQTTVGTQFQVQVTVTSGCRIDTDVSGPVNFGSVAGTAAAPADQNRTVGVTCTNGTAYNVYFVSANAMTGTNRFMINGAESIGYRILRTGTPVGDTAGTGFAGTGTGTTQNYALVFNVNGWSAVTPALYTDQVTMQIDF